MPSPEVGLQKHPPSTWRGTNARIPTSPMRTRGLHKDTPLSSMHSGQRPARLQNAKPSSHWSCVLQARGGGPCGWGRSPQPGRKPRDTNQGAGQSHCRGGVEAGECGKDCPGPPPPRVRRGSICAQDKPSDPRTNLAERGPLLCEPGSAWMSRSRTRCCLSALSTRLRASHVRCPMRDPRASSACLECSWLSTPGYKHVTSASTQLQTVDKQDP